VFDGPFALAVAAGMAATVNPCGFALLPAYLAAFLGDERPGAAGVPRAFAVGTTMTAGFVVVFGLFGAVISPLTRSIERHLPWVTIVLGIGLVGLGIALLAGRHLTVRIPRLDRGGRTGSLGSMFVFGISYAIASLSCTIGPFLAVTSTTFGRGDLLSGVAVFVAYGAGMGAVVTVLTVAAALTRTGLVGRLRRVMPHLSRISGGFLVAAGAYVGWYGWYEVRVFRGDSAEDPVVSRALEVQTWLQARIVPEDPVAALAWAALALAVVAGFAWFAERRRDRRRTLTALAFGAPQSSTADPSPLGDPVPVTVPSSPSADPVRLETEEPSHGRSR
jgi:cytochrome c-type biogenesis protein